MSAEQEMPMQNVGGEGGAAAHAIRVFGDMNSQHAAGSTTGNLIDMQGGTAEVIVPAALVAAAEMYRRSRKGGRKMAKKTIRVGGKKQKKTTHMMGGEDVPTVETPIVAPVEAAVEVAETPMAGGITMGCSSGGKKQQKKQKKSQKKSQKKQRKQQRKKSQKK